MRYEMAAPLRRSASARIQDMIRRGLPRLRRTTVGAEIDQKNDQGHDVSHEANKRNYRLPAIPSFLRYALYTRKCCIGVAKLTLCTFRLPVIEERHTMNER